MHLHGWRWESRSSKCCINNGGLIGPHALRPAMNHHLWRIQRVQPQRINESLLPHRPNTRSKGILPPSVIPVIHMPNQDDDGDLKSKVPTAEAGGNNLSLR